MACDSRKHAYWKMSAHFVSALFTPYSLFRFRKRIFHNVIALRTCPDITLRFSPNLHEPASHVCTSREFV